MYKTLDIDKTTETAAGSAYDAIVAMPNTAFVTSTIKNGWKLLATKNVGNRTHRTIDSAKVDHQTIRSWRTFRNSS